jgi:cell cycle checkpoint protein
MSKSRTKKKRKVEYVTDDIEDPIEWNSLKDNRQLIEKYAPLTSLELAIHKKKLDQVREWFGQIENRPRILILSGPAGCGKSTTVQVLAKEYRFDIMEYEAGMNMNAFTSSYQGKWDLAYGSAALEFREFVGSCIRSAGLTFQVGTKIHSNRRKVALIEDFPTLTDSMKSTIHSSLREYVHAPTATCPMVFIVSNIQTNAESYSSERLLSVRELFPKELLQHLAVTHIQFKPIAKTILMKSLNRICELEFRSCIQMKPSKQWIEDTCIAAAGDIRSAIYAVQLRKGNFQNLSCRDHQLSIFSGLGKILYNKRVEAYGHEEDLLKVDLFSKRRRAFEFNPENLFESLGMSASLFLDYLQENYLRNCSQVCELVSCSEYLSIAELIGSKWDQYQTLAAHSSSIASRGLLFSWLPEPSKKHSFQTLSKSRIWKTNQKSKEIASCWYDQICVPAEKEYLLFRKTGILDKKLTISRIIDSFRSLYPI